MECLGSVKAAEEIQFKMQENSVLKERITMEMFCRCCNIGRERDIYVSENGCMENYENPLGRQ